MICENCSFYHKKDIEMVLVHIFNIEEILYQCPDCKRVVVTDV